MILHRYKVKSPTTEVTICPIGDIQWSGDRDDIAYDHLEEHIALCLKQPDPLFIGLGDYIDFASPSNREALQQARLYDTARKVIANASKALVDDLYHRLLAPTRGKWLGLTQGHHHHPLILDPKKPEQTVDSDEYLAGLLKAPFSEEFALIKLEFGSDEHTVTFLAYHGSGSSVFPWGPLTRMYRLTPNFLVDFMLMGHQTKLSKTAFDRVHFPDTGPNRLEHRSIRLISTGGWSKGYVSGKATYVSRAAMSPVALGQPLVHIRPRFRTSTELGTKVWERRITEES